MKILKAVIGITTGKLHESRDFYSRLFGFAPVWESDWYIHLRNGDTEIGLLVPGHESQPPLFRGEFAGEGMWISFEVDNAGAEFSRLEALHVPFECELRDEPWGERHFAVRDPNGVGINVSTKIAMTPEYAAHAVSSEAQ